MRKMKIVPLNDEKSTALGCLNSPEAMKFITEYNLDVDFENEKVLQMDNVVQGYMDEEDAMITSGLGLLAGMRMKGAIFFRDFKTTFSTTKYLKGYYNSRDGERIIIFNVGILLSA